jgi:phospholipid-transporting ATPase
MIDSWVLTCYNLIFTLLPPFVMGIFEKDVDEVTLEKWPSLYKGLKEDRFGFGQSFTVYSFSVWVAEALYHSAVVFFVTIYTCSPESFEGVIPKSDGNYNS